MSTDRPLSRAGSLPQSFHFSVAPLLTTDQISPLHCRFTLTPCGSQPAGDSGVSFTSMSADRPLSRAGSLLQSFHFSVAPLLTTDQISPLHCRFTLIPCGSQPAGDSGVSFTSMSADRPLSGAGSLLQSFHFSVAPLLTTDQTSPLHCRFTLIPCGSQPAGDSGVSFTSMSADRPLSRAGSLLQSFHFSVAPLLTTDQTSSLHCRFTSIPCGSQPAGDSGVSFTSMSADRPLSRAGSLLQGIRFSGGRVEVVEGAVG